MPSLQWAKIGELDAMQFDERPSKVEHLEVICDFPDTFQCHESKIVEDPTRARRLNCDRVVVVCAFLMLGEHLCWTNLAEIFSF